MTVTGDKEILKNLKKAGIGITDALGAALMKEGYAVQAGGQPKTPVASGILRRSWYVAPPTGRKNPVVEVGVGTSYAIYQHERTPGEPFKTDKQRRYFFAVVAPTLKAKKKVGGPKFISSVIDKRRSGYVKRISDWTWEFYRKGIGIRSIPRTAPEKPSSESMGV